MDVLFYHDFHTYINIILSASRLAPNNSESGLIKYLAPEPILVPYEGKNSPADMKTRLYILLFFSTPTSARARASRDKTRRRRFTVVVVYIYMRCQRRNSLSDVRETFRMSNGKIRREIRIRGRYSSIR